MVLAKTRPDAAGTLPGAVRAPLVDRFASFVVEPDARLTTVAAGDDLSVDDRSGRRARFRLEQAGGTSLRLEGGLPDGQEGLDAAAAVLEAIFAQRRDIEALPLTGRGWAAHSDRLLRAGFAVAADDGCGAGVLHALPDMLWQAASNWTVPAASSFPQSLAASGDRRHPRRPPKPRGTVYARFIPWLGGTLSFRVATPEADVACLNRWMNDPRVDEFWNEAGDIDRHRRYLADIARNPQMTALIGCFEGRPFSYFEVYWAKESVIGPFYEAGDYDRGWHVIVGEDGFRGRAWISAWLPSLMHYMFLDEPRTQRIVGEPQADHHRQLRNLARSGFARVKTIDLPQKRAALVSLSRERFFADRLWHPAPGDLAV